MDGRTNVRRLEGTLAEERLERGGAMDQVAQLAAEIMGADLGAVVGLAGGVFTPVGLSRQHRNLAPVAVKLATARFPHLWDDGWEFYQHPGRYRRPVQGPQRPVYPKLPRAALALVRLPDGSAGGVLLAAWRRPAATDADQIEQATIGEFLQVAHALRIPATRMTADVNAETNGHVGPEFRFMGRMDGEILTVEFLLANTDRKRTALSENTKLRAGMSKTLPGFKGRCVYRWAAVWQLFV